MPSAGEITLVDSSELFDKVSNNEVVFVNGEEDVVPSMSVSYGEDDKTATAYVGHGYLEA